MQDVAKAALPKREPDPRLIKLHRYKRLFFWSCAWDQADAAEAERLDRSFANMKVRNNALYKL